MESDGNFWRVVIHTKEKPLGDASTTTKVSCLYMKHSFIAQSFGGRNIDLYIIRRIIDDNEIVFKEWACFINRGKCFSTQKGNVRKVWLMMQWNTMDRNRWRFFSFTANIYDAIIIMVHSITTSSSLKFLFSLKQESVIPRKRKFKDVRIYRVWVITLPARSWTFINTIFTFWPCSQFLAVGSM